MLSVITQIATLAIVALRSVLILTGVMSSYVVVLGLIDGIDHWQKSFIVSVDRLSFVEHSE